MEIAFRALKIVKIFACGALERARFARVWLKHVLRALKVELAELHTEMPHINAARPLRSVLRSKPAFTGLTYARFT